MTTQPTPRQGETEDPPSPAERVVRYVCTAAAAVASLLVLVTLAATGYSVVLRYVFGTPITWIDELSGYLVVAMVMLGAAEALRRNDHISVDLLTTRLRGRWALAFEIWWMLCVIAVAAAIIHSGIKAVRFSYDFGIYSEGYLEMPMWLPQSVLLVGAGLLLLSALARIASLLRGPGKTQ